MHPVAGGIQAGMSGEPLKLRDFVSRLERKWDSVGSTEPAATSAVRLMHQELSAAGRDKETRKYFLID